jgi:hypothetical protein
VHNALMFDKRLKTVASASFRPFPRSVRHGEPAFFPMRPWFLSNKTSKATARKPTRFAAGVTRSFITYPYRGDAATAPRLDDKSRASWTVP